MNRPIEVDIESVARLARYRHWFACWKATETAKEHLNFRLMKVQEDMLPSLRSLRSWAAFQRGVVSAGK